MIDHWSIENFSLSNPQGGSQGDIPVLLRRMADLLEGLPGDVQDIVFHNEKDENGEPWPSLTIYFNSDA